MDKFRIKRTKVIRFALSICIVVLFVFNKIANGQIGVKIGSTASSFHYTDINPNPYQNFDIDLRPFFGYDIELA